MSEEYFPALAGGFDRLLSSLAGRAVAVVGHARPDGDCIGSQSALVRVLRAAGYSAFCVNADPVPRRLKFLVPDLEFLGTDEVLASAADYAAVFVDCADHARAGERLKARFPLPLGNIDHHLSNVGFAAQNLVDSGAAATCEILAGIFLDRGLPVDALTAQSLYAGILTDTGQFRFNSTSRRCFSLAGELVARGAAPAEAGFELYERESPGKLRLLERFLASLVWECDGRVCLGTLPEGVFAATGSGPEDTEGLVDYARSVDGVEIGVLIEERPGGGTKASLRAKDPRFRVDSIAAQFGGGGHACAAGLNIPLGRDHFRTALLAALTQRLQEVDAAPRLIMLQPVKELEGILLIDKPSDHTSHDVVARLRGKLRMKKIGHAGTLDPMATGLLVVLLGKATRLSQYLISVDKEYEGTVELGKVTDSQDADGEVMETRPVPALTEADVTECIRGFCGDQYQTPPMYSAIKIGGVPLYKRARRGEEVEREPRFIRVMSWDLLKFELPRFDFRLRCTKGTYVRTLAHDLGQKLGCGGHLAALRRTASGSLRVEQALTLDALEALTLPEIERRLVPAHEAAPAHFL